MMVVWYTPNKYRYPGTVASTGSKIDTHKKVVQWGKSMFLCFRTGMKVLYEGTVRTSLATTSY